jgi:thiamine biosynthesis lipoprotein
LAGLPGLLAAGSGFAAGTQPPPRRWRGTVLGAESLIILHHEDTRRAQTLIQACVGEIRRLENIFSLQKPASALARLNEAGSLARPPPELLDILAQSTRLSRLSGGAFDVTVQPLWDLYAAHFDANQHGARGPDDTDIAHALRLVDYRAVEFDGAGIRFSRPGMAITLNGIAQGYVTDKVVGLLHAAGVEDVLVDLGETRVLGAHPDGRPWRVGLADPVVPTHVYETHELDDQALATSAGYGTRFDPAGRHHHLLDPNTGRSAQHYKSVSVIAPGAATADGLSTALSIAPPERTRPLLHAYRPAKAIIMTNDGAIERFGFVF